MQQKLHPPQGHSQIGVGVWSGLSFGVLPDWGVRHGCDLFVGTAPRIERPSGSQGPTRSVRASAHTWSYGDARGLLHRRGGGLVRAASRGEQPAGCDRGMIEEAVRARDTPPECRVAANRPNAPAPTGSEHSTADPRDRNRPSPTQCCSSAGGSPSPHEYD